MNNPTNAYSNEQLEVVGELLAGREETSPNEVSTGQSKMAIQILQKLGGESVTGFNPRLTLRKELRVLRTDEEARKLFGETFERLCDVSLVRVREARPYTPNDSKRVGLTFLGRKAYREIFGRMAPVSQPRSR